MLDNVFRATFAQDKPKTEGFSGMICVQEWSKTEIYPSQGTETFSKGT
jgi:hypothetical protein